MQVRPPFSAPYLSLAGRFLVLAALWLPLLPAHAAQQIVVQLKWLHQFQFAGYYAALEKGYYREAGLDVVLKEARPGYDEHEEVLSGRAHFGVANSSLILQRGRGRPVVVLASIFQHSPDVLLVRKADGLQRVEQLIGKRVMLGQHNEEVLAYFKKLNIAFDSLERVEHSFNPQDLVSGKVDAMSAYVTDAMYHLDKMGTSYLVYSPRSVGIDFYGDNLYTTETLLQSQPKMVREFRAASLRGWQYAMNNPEEIIDLIYRKYSTRLSREHLMYEAQQMVPLLQANLIEMGYMNPLRWKQIANTYADLGMLRQDFPLQGFLYQESRPLAPNWLYASLAGAALMLAFTASLLMRQARSTRRLRRERQIWQQSMEKKKGQDERLVLALRAVGDGVWDWDNQSGKVVYSRTYREMLGYEEDEFPNLPNAWMDKVHPEDKNEMAVGVRRYFQSSPDPVSGREPTFSSEYRMQHKDGSWRWMMSRGHVVARDAEGRPLRMTGTLSDISERKEAEQEQFQRLLEVSPEAMLLVDEHGDIIFVNQAGCKLFAWQREQLQGKSIEILVPMAKREAHIGLRKNFMNENGPARNMASRQVYALRRDGTEIPIEAVLAHLPLAGRKVVVVTVRDISERKLAEMSLKSSEERYRQIVETAAEGIWTIGLDGKTVFANPRLIEMLGYDLEQIKGRPLTDFMDEEGIGLARRFLQQVDQGSTERSDLKFCRRDGKSLWVSMAASPIKNERGEMTGAMAMLTDVGERRAAVDALRANNQRLASIFNTVTNGVILQNRDGQILESNAAAKQMLGLPEHGVPKWMLRSGEGKDKAAMAGAQGAEYPAQQVWRSGEAVRNVELGVPQADGSLLWLSVNAEPIRDHEGKISLVVSSFTDITQSKLAADMLRQSEERLHEIIEAIPVAIFIKDAGGKFLLINHAAESQFGVGLAELKGNDGREHFSAAQCYRQFKSDEDAWHKRQLLEEEEILWDVGKGEDRHIRTYRKPVFDESGKPSYLICVSVDVSEHKRAEKQLKDLNESLEERVVKRTLQLNHAKRQAEEANQSKGAFLANMSHEIRTPLNALIGLTYLTMQTELSGKQRDYLEKIRFASEHLLGIINDILDFSKIDAGMLELEELEFGLNQVLQNVSDMVVARAYAKGLELVTDIAPDVPQRVRGDSLRLGQILINLVNNAIKFSDQGQIAVRVKLLEQNETECKLQFEVIDQGIGISEQGRKKLFQSFQQADTSTTREFGGTGLGLAICRQLVYLMKGEIDVESELGKGSRFWFVVRFVLPYPKSTSVQEESTALSQLHLQDYTILLAEDNPFNQQIACEMLQQTGANVVVAENGQQALELLVTQKIDCVLMDVQMPVMDGLQACRTLRTWPQTADLCVIAMTANATTDDKEKCLQAGMNDFLTKPVHPQALCKLLRQYLQTAAAPTAPEQTQAPSQAQAHIQPLPQVGPPAAAQWPMDSALLDLRVLMQMVGDAPEKLRKFTREFVRSCNQGLEDMQAALTQGERQRCRDLAHRMKSAARTVGALEFARLCQQIEDNSDTDGLAGIEDTYAKLQQLWQLIVQEIAAYPQLRP